jgi:hypothetical protein
LAREIEEQIQTLRFGFTGGGTRVVERVPGAFTVDFAARTIAKAILAATPERDQGKQLGRFRLLKKVGQGGMGVVYRAEDSAEGTIVAIKIPLGDFRRDPEAKRRFRKEARLLAQVDNPYVARF